MSYFNKKYLFIFPLLVTLLVCNPSFAFNFKKSITKLKDTVSDAVKQPEEETTQKQPEKKTTQKQPEKKTTQKQPEKKTTQKQNGSEDHKKSKVSKSKSKTVPTETYEILIPENSIHGISGDKFVNKIDNKLVVWDLSQNKKISSMSIDELYKQFEISPDVTLTHLCLTESGTVIFCFNHDDLIMREIKSGTISRIRTINGFLKKVDTNSDGNLLLFSQDSRVSPESPLCQVIDTRTNKEILSLPRKYGLFISGIFSNDNTKVYVAINSHGKGYILGFDLESGKRVYKRKLERTVSKSDDFAISQDGRFLASLNVLLDLKDQEKEFSLSAINKSRIIDQKQLSAIKNIGFYDNKLVLSGRTNDYKMNFIELDFNGLEQLFSLGEREPSKSFQQCNFPQIKESHNSKGIITQSGLYWVSEKSELGDTIISVTKASSSLE